MMQPVHLGHKLIVHSGRKMYFIDIDTIRYVEACNYYALIHTPDKTFVVRQTLDELEHTLSQHSFFRIHRSVILNLEVFQCIERENNSMMVRTTIGRDFRISRYRQKYIREALQKPV